MNELLWFVVNEESRVDVYDLPFRPSAVTSKAAMCGHLKTGHREAAGTSGFYAFGVSLSILISRLSCNLGLRAPTAWPKLQQMSVVQQAVEHGCDCGCVAE